MTSYRVQTGTPKYQKTRRAELSQKVPLDSEYVHQSQDMALRRGCRRTPVEFGGLLIEYEQYCNSFVIDFNCLEIPQKQTLFFNTVQQFSECLL